MKVALGVGVPMSAALPGYRARDDPIHEDLERSERISLLNRIDVKETKTCWWWMASGSVSRAATSSQCCSGSGSLILNSRRNLPSLCLILRHIFRFYLKDLTDHVAAAAFFDGFTLTPHTLD